MIAVVIPFYQHQPGLLRQALLSVAAQDRVRPAEILVVDDGSPISAEQELADLPSWLAAMVRILDQPNRGAGAARNRALDAVSPGVKVVAFLDSDDAWSENHLANIKAAYEAGAAFYFADHQRAEDPETRFVQCDYRPDGPAVSQASGVEWCKPDQLMQAIIRRSPVGTSTVAISREAIGEQRFPTGFRAAGEDSIFWLGVLNARPRVVCSMGCEAIYGRGVSIFNHRSWGDERVLRTILDEMRAQLFFRAHFAADDKTAAMIDERCSSLDVGYWRAMIACARRGRWQGMAPSALYVTRRPQALLRLPQAVVQVLCRRTPGQLPGAIAQ